MQPSRAHLLRLVLSLVLGFTAAQQCDFAGPRLDCGFVGITAQQCRDQGCCWSPAEFEGSPHIDLPWCFHSNNEPSTYAVGSIDQHAFPEGSGGSGDLDDASLELQQSTLSQLGADIKHLKASVKEISPGIVRLRITDAQNQRWEVPSKLFPAASLAGGGSGSRSSSTVNSSNIDIQWDNDPFAVRITLPSKDSTTSTPKIFDSAGLRLIFKDQYIELSTYLSPDATLYGAGERASNTLHLIRNGMPRVLWNQDKGPSFSFLEQNSYSSYPFVLALDQNSGTSWGYFMLNSNGMEIVPSADKLSWRIIGGMIDLFILTGPTPAAVLDQLTSVVGRPALMPYWSLGWQQSKYGYRSIWEIEDVVAKYAENGLPLETIVTDIDHMERWKDFSFDPVNYPLAEMQRFVAELEKKGQKWVPIVDPGIAVVPGYEPHDTGVKENVFLKEYDGTTNYLGWCWPGAAYFPDFLAEAGQRFLKKFLTSWHSQVPFSGLWIDMNEASNFCTGDVCKFSKELKTTAGSTAAAAASKTKKNKKNARVPGSNETDDPPPWVCQLDCTTDIRPQLNATMLSFLDPPYPISSSLNRQNLGTKGISVLATHLDGSLQYNTHNIYSLAECQATSAAVQEITGKRPFVLTRSSFTGVGAYAAHWSGDNAATWQSMAQSLPQILSYGLQGIPMGGADTGFAGDISEELAARWLSLSAIAYPFARSHSDLHSRHQEPYLWPSVLQAVKKSLDMRYKLLSYFYTLHRIASENGMPVMRPLWLTYPQDKKTHRIDTQVMLGDVFLVTPVLQQSADTVKGYFPAGTTWYDMFEESENIDTRSGAQEIEVFGAISRVPVPLHMAGGNIIAMHDFSDQQNQEKYGGFSLVTAQVRRSPLTLLIALKHPILGSKARSGSAGVVEETQIAEGFMFLDDGDSLHTPGVPAVACNFLKFSARVVEQEEAGLGNAGEVTINFGVPDGFAGSEDFVAIDEDIPASCQGFEWPELQKVKILGWEQPLSSARLEVAQAAAGGVAAEMKSADLQWELSKHLEFTIPEGSRALKRSEKLVLTWSSASSDKTLLVRGRLHKEPVLAADY